MYLELMQATENAIQCLIEAQRKCEEIYMNAKETPISAVPISEKEMNSDQKGL